MVARWLASASPAGSRNSKEDRHSCSDQPAWIHPSCLEQKSDRVLTNSRPKEITRCKGAAKQRDGFLAFPYGHCPKFAICSPAHSPSTQAMATRTRKLLLAEVQDLIAALLSKGDLGEADLLSFAQLINGGPFKSPPPPKIKPLTATAAKKAVLAHFECSTVPQLRKCASFLMQMGDEEFALKSTDDWLKLYRKFIAVPEHERNGTGPTFVNGIDVLQNFRPWHVFGLNPETATAEDVKTAFRDLVKVHHPDKGGDARVFERLQKMRDSVLALMG